MLGITHELRIGINARQRGNRAHKHRHGMRRVTESLHEFLGGLVQHGVVGDVIDPLLELFFGGQVAEQEQVRHFQEGAALGQDLDGISPVAQDAFIAVNVGDGALARCRV